jgi:hypothetical protein
MEASVIPLNDSHITSNLFFFFLIFKNGERMNYF